MTPRLQGVSHLALSVPTIGPAREFWVGVLAFHEVIAAEGFSLLLHPTALLAVGLTTNAGRVRGTFTETNPGLDHVALAVEDEDELRRWQAHLDHHGIDHSPIAESDSGHHLHFRTPEGIPIELYVMGAQMRAVVGLSAATPAIARTHDLPAGEYADAVLPH